MNRKKGLRLLFLFSMTALLITLYSSLVFAANKVEVLGTLPNKKAITHQGTINGENYIYHKFKITKPGYVDVSGKRVTSYGYTYGISYVLCNSKKQVIDYRTSNYVNAENDQHTLYSLTKGTYYIRMDGKTTNNAYVLGLYFKSVSDAGGSTQAKATGMTAKKAYSDIIGATSSASATSWFKFYANGSKTVKLTTVNYGEQGSFRVTVIGPHMNQSFILSENRNMSSELYTLVGGKKRALTAGTYYVKITKVSARSNGFLKLKWQYK